MTIILELYRDLMASHLGLSSLRMLSTLALSLTNPTLSSSLSTARFYPAFVILLMIEGTFYRSSSSKRALYLRCCVKIDREWSGSYPFLKKSVVSWNWDEAFRKAFILSSLSNSTKGCRILLRKFIKFPFSSKPLYLKYLDSLNKAI